MEDAYYNRYLPMKTKFQDKAKERTSQFQQFVEKHKYNSKIIQFGVRKQKISEKWISIDLYDRSPVIDYNWDIMNLPISDDTFDGIVCNAILEHVPYPEKAIQEMYRILAKDGEIWAEIPFIQPYHPSPQDYWRVSPIGIDIWFNMFNKIDSGMFYAEGSPIYVGAFFHGRK